MAVGILLLRSLTPWGWRETSRGLSWASSRATKPSNHRLSCGRNNPSPRAGRALPANAFPWCLILEERNSALMGPGQELGGRLVQKLEASHQVTLQGWLGVYTLTRGREWRTYAHTHPQRMVLVMYLLIHPLVLREAASNQGACLDACQRTSTTKKERNPVQLPHCLNGHEFLIKPP